MSRRKGADKRVVNPDPRYNNVLVSKFTNGLMQRGKKSLARRIFYDAMDLIDQRVPDEEPMVVFEQAMENVRPRVEVKSRRVGGAAPALAAFSTAALHWASMSAKTLNNTPFPSITGLEASGPILPRPNTAVPLLITATRFPFVV